MTAENDVFYYIVNGARFFFELKDDAFYFIVNGERFLIDKGIRKMYLAPRFDYEVYTDEVRKKIYKMTGLPLFRWIVEEQCEAIAMDVYGLND